MACLLHTQDVVCLWNDRHFKIQYASHFMLTQTQLTWLEGSRVTPFLARFNLTALLKP